MKYVTFIIAVLIALALSFSSADAWQLRKPVVTPYGDYCPKCTKYGVCNTVMSHEDAKKAMLDYYRAKGLGVELEKKKGRFIRAKIKEQNKVIDVIIFDRRTGRIRSIY